jgi:DNA invertase Pin-like site-specific DNA recombinase
MTARLKAGEVEAFKAQGLSLSEIARRLEIGKASVHRILAAQAAPSPSTKRRVRQPEARSGTELWSKVGDGMNG